MRKNEAIGILRCISGGDFKKYVKPRLLKLKEGYQLQYNNADEKNWHERKADLKSCNDLMQFFNKLTLTAQKVINGRKAKKYY